MIRLVKATETIYRDLDHFLNCSGLKIADLKYMLETDEHGQGNVQTIRQKSYFLNHVELSDPEIARIEKCSLRTIFNNRKKAEEKVKDDIDGRTNSYPPHPNSKNFGLKEKGGK